MCSKCNDVEDVWINWNFMSNWPWWLSEVVHNRIEVHCGIAATSPLLTFKAKSQSEWTAREWRKLIIDCPNYKTIQIFYDIIESLNMNLDDGFWLQPITQHRILLPPVTTNGKDSLRDNKKRRKRININLRMSNLLVCYIVDGK